MSRFVLPVLSDDDASVFASAFAEMNAWVFAATTGHDVREAAYMAANGGQVMLFVSPSAVPTVFELFGLTARAVPVVAQVDNPLVAERVTTCVGCGVADGTTVPLERVLVLHGVDAAGGEVVACTRSGDVVAVRRGHGAGAVTIIGGALPPGAATGTAAHWVASILGAGGDAERFVRALSMAPVLEQHPDVPVVEATAWDTSLVPTRVRDVNDPTLLSAAGHAGRLLPAAVHDALVDFADTSNSAGALLIRGVPIGEVPATPPSPTQARKPDVVSECMLLTCARRLGQPVGYAPEHGGDLVQNICPTRDGAARQVSTSSQVVLEYHTEAAHHPHKPRFLLLLCLRGDPAAATTLCSVHAVLGELTARERQVLSEPRFTTGIDESYTGTRSAARSLPRPILTGTPLRPRLTLDNDLMLGIDEEAQAALSRIAELVRTRGTSVTLAAGDLLVVDNEVAVHGRSPFTPRFDGTDRWLQRAMVVADHSVLGPDLVGRIVATQFVRS